MIYECPRTGLVFKPTLACLARPLTRVLLEAPFTAPYTDSEARPGFLPFGRRTVENEREVSLPFTAHVCPFSRSGLFFSSNALDLRRPRFFRQSIRYMVCATGSQEATGSTFLCHGWGARAREIGIDDVHWTHPYRASTTGCFLRVSVSSSTSPGAHITGRELFLVLLTV